jgi:hypothetical protein
LGAEQKAKLRIEPEDEAETELKTGSVEPATVLEAEAKEKSGAKLIAELGVEPKTE